AVLASQGPLPLLPNPVHHAFQVPPSLGLEVVNQDFVDDAHAGGMAVHVWTINQCQEMLDLLALGVDAIMTDRPQLLEQLLAQPEDGKDCGLVNESLIEF
ncbi:MAG: glycerophosphodiester phosphodiesterase family protein, partial [Oceanococcus sp.]